MTNEAFSVARCACATCVAYGLGDRDRRTGHHVACCGRYVEGGGGPYRSEAPGARAASALAERMKEREAIARSLATGRWIQQDGRPATHGDQCAVFHPDPEAPAAEEREAGASLAETYGRCRT